MNYIIHNNYFQHVSNLDSITDLLLYLLCDATYGKLWSPKERMLKGIELWIDSDDKIEYYQGYAYLYKDGIFFLLESNKLEIDPRDNYEDDINYNYLELKRISKIIFRYDYPHVASEREVNSKWKKDDMFEINFETSISKCYFVWEVSKDREDYDGEYYYWWEYEIRRLPYYIYSNEDHKCVFGPDTYDDCLDFTQKNKPKINLENYIEENARLLKIENEYHNSFPEDDNVSNRDSFNELTDGQLGSYDDFGGDLDDAKRQLGRD